MPDSGLVLAPTSRVVDASIAAIAGGRIEFYNAGTTTAKTVYSNSTLATSLGTIVYLDSSGHPVASQGSSTKVLIYTGSDLIKLVVKDADGATVETYDNVRCAQVAGSGSGSGVMSLPFSELASTSYLVTSADYGELKEFDLAGGNCTVVLPAAIDAGNGTIFGALRKGASNTLTITPVGSDEIAGAGSYALVADGDSAMFVSDGASEWKLWSFARPSLAVGAITSDLLDPRIVGGLAAVGDIKMVAMDDVPTGWLECDGATVSRTTYADLFAAIGTTWGTGNGTTTFHLPDMRGRVPRGWAHGNSRDPDRASRTASNTGGATGDNVGSVQADALQDHTHTFSGNSVSSFSGGTARGADGNGAGLSTGTTSAVSGATASTETRMENAGVMFIILADPAAAGGASGTLQTIHNGAGAPSGALGIDGDFYIDTTADAIYGPKAAGAWGSGTSLIGPTGATGATGPAGSTGATGAAGAAGATGASGPVPIDYTWDTGTTAADPGSGKIRANNATLSSATALYISETDRLGNGLAALIQSWDDSTSTTKGVLQIIDLVTPANRVYFNVTGTVSDGGYYDTITVSHRSGATSLTAVNVALMFFATGDKGADGAGAGDVIAASNFGTDNTIIRADGTLKGVQSSGVAIDDTTFSLYPTTSDSGALGKTTNMWGDLFLASGGVVNWNNGDVTITHSANALAFAGASSGYTFDAVVTAGTTAATAVKIDPSGFVEFPEVSAPSTPASGFLRAYAKTDGKLYQKNDAGTETDLSATGGGGSGSPSIPQGRITLTSATPVLTSTVSGATTVFYALYTGRYVPLYDGSAWTMTDIAAELSQTTTDTTKSPAACTTNSNYDLFVWSDGGTYRCTRGPAWTSDTGRGTGAGTTELERVTGILVNKIAITNGPAAQRGTYVGTIRTNGSSQIDFNIGASSTNGTAGFIGVWNAYNRRPWAANPQDSTASWTYTTAAWRAANASNSMRVSYVCGLNEDAVSAVYAGVANVSASGGGYGVGYDSTSALATGSAPGAALVAGTSSATAILAGASGLGFHYVQALEYGGTGLTFYGIQTAGRTLAGMQVMGQY